MGIELLEIGIRTRKGMIFTMKWCFRSVYNHPFFVGFLCFLLFLYRSSPFIFSLLVSASPVLICTALLLGTLLSYGQPNIPEIEMENKTFHEAVPLKTRVSEDDTVVHRNNSYYVETYGDRRKDEARDQLGFSDDAAPLIDERSRDTDLTNGEISEGNEQKAEWDEGRFSDAEIVENHYSSIPKVNDENHESDNERSDGGDSFDSEGVNVASLDSLPHSPWKRVEERDEEEEEEDGDDLDSGLDRAESSSPDASMADIIPMLDELHPLLNEEAAEPFHMSSDGSDAASERSSSKSSTDHESGDDMENHEQLENMENEDGEDEEDAEGDKEHRTKSAITWTEEDQKNLMDLGSIELERNQRLEHLILRRRAKKNLVPERNLIDLESSDLPFNVPPISTTRRNPFELSHDSYDHLGLPPIPGSAPSILLPRRNPFDIPYDSSEEKPNLVGDGVLENLTTFQSKEPIFRRRESFNVEPSNLAFSRQDVKFRPYFVPERMVSEESGYKPFQRQWSELSESKVSSVPETESLGSVEDIEERRKLIDEDNQRELELVSSMKEVNEKGSPDLIYEREVTEEDEAQELEPISETEHVSEHVGHGSQSSEEEESLEDGDSSTSSLSEVSERVFTEIDGNIEEPAISTQTSVGSTDLRINNTMIDDVLHKEPVYDTSPLGVRKNFSSSSISSDVHLESDLSLPPELVKRTVLLVDGDSDGSTDEDIPNIEMFSESSNVHPTDEKKSKPMDVLVDQHTSFGENSRAVVEPYEYQNLNQSEEDKYLVIGETSESQSALEHSIEEKETLENSQLANSDSDIYLEANEKLSSMTPYAEGNSTSFFYDKLLNEPFVQHFNEVQKMQMKKEVPINSEQARNDTVVESLDEVRTIQELNMSEIQEIDQGTSTNVNSPLSPDFISIPSTVSPTFYADLQTIIEETNEIKEIDEGILLELDSIGDFSTFGSNELEKRIYSVGESSQTSTVTGVEEVIVNPREEIDIYEEDMENISEIQTSERCAAEHIDILDKEFNGSDGQESLDQGTSEDDTPSKKNEDVSVKSVVNDGIAKVESTSLEAEPSHQSHVEIDNASSEIPEREAQTIADVELAFKQMTDKEIGNSSVLKEPQAELSIDETVMQHSEDDSNVNLIHKTKSEMMSGLSHQGQVEIDNPSEMPEPEVDFPIKKAESISAVAGKAETETRSVEDIDLAFEHIGEIEIEKPVFVEPPNSDLLIPESMTQHSEDEPHVINSVDETQIFESRSIGDASFDKPDVVELRETRESTSELHDAVANASESLSLILDQVVDCDLEKPVKPSSSDGSELTVDKVESSVNHPNNEVKVPDEMHSTKSGGKAKISKSLSSSSSSSSESSSSDSDKE